MNANSELHPAQSKRLLLIGIIGCVCYMIGDLLYAATGANQSTEMVGLLTKVAFLDMSTWRMVASIICGAVATVLYFMGFHEMYHLLDVRIVEAKKRIWIKLFRVAYMTGTIFWTFGHALFMTNALIFKFVYQEYGDMQKAAEIADKVFYCNAPPLVVSYILCDVGLMVISMALIWNGTIGIQSVWGKILGSCCNPVLSLLLCNLITLLPWPIDQLDHASESMGHGLVLVLGLIMLRNMSNCSGQVGAVCGNGKRTLKKGMKE